MTAPVTTRPRLVALGASNLARGMLALLDAARTSAGGPVEAHAALGRGRSYGMRSSLLGRGLAGITNCGLWPALSAAPPAPTTAVLMDVGNDLLYGVDVPGILGWIECALQRLAGTRTIERSVVLGLPMAAIRTLPNWRYLLVRSILVPQCRLPLAVMLDRAERVHHGLAALAQHHGATFHELQEQWYGFDPVHIRHRHWPAAARQWLGVGSDPTVLPAATNGAFARLRFLGTTPAERTWFGWPHHATQPTRRWVDGTTLSLW